MSTSQRCMVTILAVLIVHLCHGENLSITWDTPQASTIWTNEEQRLGGGILCTGPYRYVVTQYDSRLAPFRTQTVTQTKWPTNRVASISVPYGTSYVDVVAITLTKLTSAPSARLRRNSRRC